MDRVEIRVHGIGDHHVYSALGTPSVESATNRADVARPPVVPAHRLKLVTWSRASRGLSAGLLWYLAFPFTLVNAAGNMGPAKGAPRIVLRVAVATVGVLLTIAAAAWLIVLAETVLRVIPVGADPVAVSFAISVGVPVILAAAIVARAKWRRLAIRRSVLSLNVAALVAFGTLVAWTRPAQIAYSGWPSRRTPAYRADPSSPGIERLDAMIAIVVVTTAATLVLAGAVLVARLFSDSAASMAGAAALLVIAVVSLHTVSSMLRVGVDWFFVWLSPVPPGHSDALTAWDRALMAYYDRGTIVSSRLDFIVAFGAVTIAGLYVCARTAIRFGKPGPRPPRSESGVARGQWSHQVVAAMPDLLGKILWSASAVALVTSGLLVWWRESLLTGLLGFHITQLVHATAAVTVLALLLRHRLPMLSNAVGRFADVVGFWPVQHHPLSGVSYRAATLAGIDHAVGESPSVVLVGHSQGSVVCAWWLWEHRDKPPPSVSLVTCGSPAASLYQVYFPSHFTTDFFQEVKGRSPDWKNFWRDTDPIASNLPNADNERLDDPAPPLTVAEGHSDYWTDPTQTTWIANRLATQTTVPTPE